MWSSRLFWKLFLAYAGLNVVLSVGILVIVARWQRTQLREGFESRLRDDVLILHAVANRYWEPGDRQRLQAVVQEIGNKTDTRLTVVAADGTVLADSEASPAEMDNHAERSEIIAARKSADHFGFSERASPTQGISNLYAAYADIRDGKIAFFVRAGVPIDTIDQRVGEVQRMLVLFALLAGIASLLISYFVVRRIIRPMAELTHAAQQIAAKNYDYQVSFVRRDEIGMLGQAFHQMQQELGRQLSELQDQSERLSTVLSGMIEGVIAVDASERILLANDASRKLLGLPKADIVGRPLLEVLRSLIVHESVSKALRTSEPVVTEMEVMTPMRLIIALRAVRLPGDPSPGVVVVLHDVTELRRLENLRREFVANVSHELKTPLASVKAYAETLRMGAINDPENNMVFVARIEEQADRLHQLILDMLHLARVESGREAFDISEVPLGDVAELCAAVHHESASSRGITLETKPPERPIMVLADEEGLRTILDNLVDNAIKYTPSGGRICISWRRETEMAVLEVSDTGIGIAPHDQARVFERFYRVDKARSRELGGTGLGLSIVKHLSQAFGGGVKLESTPGKGSTFSVRLPLANGS